MKNYLASEIQTVSDIKKKPQKDNNMM